MPFRNSKKYNKSAAQIALRYLLQRDVIIVLKSSHIERMQQNLDIFDFELNAEDMDRILELDTGQSIVVGSHHDLKITKWLCPF